MTKHWAVPEDIKQQFALEGAKFHRKTGVKIADLQQFTVKVLKLTDEDPTSFAKKGIALWTAFSEKTGAPIDDVLEYANRILHVFTEYLERKETVH